MGPLLRTLRNFFDAPHLGAVYGFFVPRRRGDGSTGAEILRRFSSSSIHPSFGSGRSAVLSYTKAGV